MRSRRKFLERVSTTLAAFYATGFLKAMAEESVRMDAN
jgi:hypothetical protein